MSSMDFFLNEPNPSNRTMDPWLTQPLTEISTMNVPGRIGRPALNADITAICEPMVLENVESSTSHNPMGLHGLL
jgi:hypothetical protein